MARRRKTKLVKSTGFAERDVSYAESGMLAAWATPPDCPGLPPSARTLDPVSAIASGVDLDPLAKPQRFNMSLSSGAFN